MISHDRFVAATAVLHSGCFPSLVERLGRSTGTALTSPSVVGRNLSSAAYAPMSVKFWAVRANNGNFFNPEVGVRIGIIVKPVNGHIALIGSGVVGDQTMPVEFH